MDYCNRCNYKHLWFLIALVAEHDQCVQHLVFIYQVPTEQTHKHTQASYLERQWKTPTSSDKQTSEHKHDRGQMRYTASILKHPERRCPSRRTSAGGTPLDVCQPFPLQYPVWSQHIWLPLSAPMSIPMFLADFFQPLWIFPSLSLPVRLLSL